MAGKNEATGDTIHLLFDAQKNAVKSLRLLGGGTMASGRYVDMEKLARQKKAAELDSISKLAKDRIAKAAAKNDSTGKAVVPDAAEKVVTPAPKGKGAPAPAPKRTAPMENSATKKDPASKAAPEPKNATEPKSSPAPAPKKQPASTEGKP